MPGAAGQRGAGVLWSADSPRLPATWVLAGKRADAVPVHCALSAMISRTRAATGSASTMLSTALRRLLE